MENYTISQVYPDDTKMNQKVDALLLAEGIRRDNNLDYTCGVFDPDYNLVATGSSFVNTLRCLAVSNAHQGEGLMNIVVTHLVNMQFAKGNSHLFLYTKCDSARFFSDLGFYKIVDIDNQLVFMENRRTGFSNYLAALQQSRQQLPKVAALVMNANPFSLGHLYLTEKASAENDLLHLFIVSEDSSLIPFHIRKKLVIEGTSHLHNICYHDSGPYIISNATFPSYFQKDVDSVVQGHALLDLTIFVEIAKTLGITFRYVGEEPNSQVTNTYNQIMKEKLSTFGIACVEVPRKMCGDSVISASAIRQAIKDGDWNTLRMLVPNPTLQYFQSNEALPIIEKIRNTQNVIHY
ncbi:MAG: [citrate (pro-3S)-lyase] ligase [Lachnospiraceae bacterium]